MSRHDPVPQEPVAVEGTVTIVPSGTQQVDVIDEATREVGITRSPPDTTTSGSFTAPGQTLVHTPISGEGVLTVQVTGTWTGQIEFEVTVDGSTWVARALHNGLDSVNATAGNGIFRLGMGAINQHRCRASALSAGQADVTIRSSRGTISSITQALPSGTNTLGAVNQGTPGSSDWRTDQRRGLTISFAPIDVAASGDNTIVAADASRRIKVLSYVVVADAAVTARWKSGAGTNLSGAMSLAANGGVSAPPVPPGGGHWMETAVNQALVLNLGSATGVRGHLSYMLEA